MEQRQNDHNVVHDVDPVLQHVGCARNPALAQIGLGNMGRRAWGAGDHVDDESGDTPAQASGGFGRTLLDEVTELVRDVAPRGCGIDDLHALPANRLSSSWSS